jgi:hypothetical protein
VYEINNVKVIPYRLQWSAGVCLAAQKILVISGVHNMIKQSSTLGSLFKEPTILKILHIFAKETISSGSLDEGTIFRWTFGFISQQNGCLKLALRYDLSIDNFRPMFSKISSHIADCHSCSVIALAVIPSKILFGKLETFLLCNILDYLVVTADPGGPAI